MANSIYQINKGINKSIELKGLRAQYIWYAAGGLLMLLILYSILYVIGVSNLVILPLIGGGSVFVITKVYAMSKKYGEHGLMKAMAARSVPAILKSKSRSLFTGLKKGTTK